MTSFYLDKSASEVYSKKHNDNYDILKVNELGRSLLESERFGHDLIRHIEENDDKNIGLDFSDVAYINSDTIGRLIHANKSLRVRNKKPLKIINPKDPVYDVFNVLRLHKLFEFDR